MKTMRLTGATALLLLATGLHAGCERHETSPPPMTPASRTASGVELATEQVASARCARELGCDNIGPEKRFSGHEDCMRSLWSNSYDDLGACEDGVAREVLRACLDAISQTKCSDAIQHLDDVAACKLAELCVD
ncbi:MAG TPA: DUF6184 family natural product biosynthesis lipoprotein [Polyangiaceae bacterium]|jgi:hypothetical protein|nr:DUF6184 family natural product biosynthesis lipoprotein [Polyangiaceae bacterium]